MQLPPLLKVPVPLLVKLTVPVGVDFIPMSTSVTVAVQVVGLLTGSGLGVQLTPVVVVRGAATVRGKVPLLVLCALSPPYEAVMVWVPVPTAVGV